MFGFAGNDFHRLVVALDNTMGERPKQGMFPCMDVNKMLAELRGELEQINETIADEAIAAAGLGGRFISRHADLFEGPYPGGADTLCLGWVCTIGMTSTAAKSSDTVTQRSLLEEHC